VALARQNGGPDSYRDRFALIFCFFCIKTKEKERQITVLQKTVA
jgi:hypothetical protein